MLDRLPIHSLSVPAHSFWFLGGHTLRMKTLESIYRRVARTSFVRNGPCPPQPSVRCHIPGTLHRDDLFALVNLESLTIHFQPPTSSPIEKPDIHLPDTPS